MPSSAAECWVLSDGKAGTENQCLGLAEAIGLPFAVKRLAVRRGAGWLPAHAWRLAGEAALRALPSGRGDRLAAPWPRLLIASGRPSVGPAMAIRRAARGATFAVQVQDPRVSPRQFDLVVAPEHDRLAGDNVLATVGALHRVTPERLAAAERRFAAELSHLPRPRVAAMIGGASRHHRLTPQAVGALCQGLQRLCREHGAGLMVSASRRTGEANRAALAEALADVPAAIWDGTGENPYFGYLALADAIVVTADSVTMASEAAATGKPLYIAALEGGAPKFARFHRSLEAAGIARPFAGALETWHYEPLRETERIAAAVRERVRLGHA